MQKLLQDLTATLDAASPSFVLIDSMLGEPIPLEIPPGAEVGNAAALNRLRSAAWQRNTFTVVLPKTIALPLHLHPYLVALQGPVDPWLAPTLKQAMDETDQALANGLAGSGSAPHRVGGWLQSHLAPEDLVAQLARMMSVNTSAYTTARYQRLADRRALDWLCCVVGEQRMCGQLGAIQRWIYLDACGQVTQLQSTGEAAATLRLTPAEWGRFMLGDMLHPTVARWMGELVHMATATPAHDTHALYSRAFTALQNVDAAMKMHPKRFMHPQDRVAWAAMTLAYPGIEKNPAVRELLNAQPSADEPPETLHTLCAALRDLHTANRKHPS